MKKFILMASIITSSLAIVPQAEATDLSLRICEYVQANDKNRLRSFLKQNKLKIRTVYDDLACNESNLLIFAAKSNSLEVGEFIISKLPAQKVKDEIENLAKYSAHLAEEAKKR